MVPKQRRDDGHPQLLRARLARPRGRGAAQRDEFAPLHSITSSARCCRNQGTSRPSALAVLRLMTSSNFVGCSTGISAGFPLCKILTTNAAARRNESGPSAPYDIRPPTSAKDRGTVAAGRPRLSASSAAFLDAKLPCTTTALAPSFFIAANVLVLWSGRGPLGTWYAEVGGPLALWRAWSTNVSGGPLDAGHFFPEEIPEQTAAELSDFFG